MKTSSTRDDYEKGWIDRVRIGIAERARDPEPPLRVIWPAEWEEADRWILSTASCSSFGSICPLFVVANVEENIPPPLRVVERSRPVRPVPSDR